MGLGNSRRGAPIWPWGLTAWICGGLLALLFAFVPPGKGWQAFDRLVQVVAAVGTLAAAGVALWLGLQSSREGQRRDYDTAAILAAGLVDLLEHGIDRVFDAIAPVIFAKIDAAQTVGEQENVLNRQLDGLKGALAAPLFEHGFETISKLAPLPGACAVRLYKARSSLKALGHDINQSTQAVDWSGKSVLDKRQKLLEWISRASTDVQSCRTVVAVLRQVATDAGAEPTQEEIYGTDDDDF